MSASYNQPALNIHLTLHFPAVNFFEITSIDQLSLIISIIFIGK